MNYLLDKKTVFKNRDKKRKSIYWFGLGLVVLLFILFFGANYLSGGSWFLAKFWWWGDRNIAELEEQSGGWFSTKKKLIETNQELVEKVNKLEIERVKWLDNLVELKELRRVFEREEEEFLPKAVGRVLAGPTFMGFDILMIDVKQEDKTSIQEGDLVKIDGTLILGQIIKQSGENLMVKLYSSVGVEVPVIVGWESFPLVLNGQGSGSWIGTIPLDSPIEIGDPVWLAGSRDLIGVVTATEEETSSSLLNVYVGLPLSLDKITWVEIYGN